MDFDASDHWRTKIDRMTIAGLRDGVVFMTNKKREMSGSYVSYPYAGEYGSVSHSITRYSTRSTIEWLHGSIEGQ
jgi:hypothetical protein